MGNSGKFFTARLLAYSTPDEILQFKETLKEFYVEPVRKIGLDYFKEYVKHVLFVNSNLKTD